MERTRTEHDGVGSSKVRAGSSITDELREYSKTTTSFPAIFKELTAIADRIDEQAKKDALTEYTRGYNAGLGIDMDELERRFTAIVRLCISNVLMHNIKAYGQGGYLTSDDVNKQPNEYIGEYVRRLLSSVECCTRPEEDTWERIIEDALFESHWDEPSPDDDDYERCKRVRDMVISELVERCKRLAGE